MFLHRVWQPNQISCHSGKKYFHKRTSKIYKIKGEINQQNLNVITKYIQKTLIIKCWNELPCEFLNHN